MIKVIHYYLTLNFHILVERQLHLSKRELSQSNYLFSGFDSNISLPG